MKTALLGVVGGNAVITKEHRKLHKGFTSVAPRSQNTDEITSRLGYQHNNNNNNDSYYLSSVYYVRGFLIHSHFNLHRSPKMQVFSILLKREQSLREDS